MTQQKRAGLGTTSLIFALIACGGPSSRGALAPAPAPSAHSTDTAIPTPKAHPAPAQRAHSCELMVHTSLERSASGAFELVVVTENPTARSLSLILHTRCPGGAVQFEGLPAGYDYGALCQQGPCAGGPTTHEGLTLAAGARVELVRIAVATGGDSCNPPLPDGRYTISASVVVDGARACSAESAVLTVAGQPAPPASPPAVVAPQRERCPAMACAYVPCPPGVVPPTDCSRVCGCAGMRGPAIEVSPSPK